MHLGLNWQALCAPYSVLDYRSSDPLTNFQIAPMPSTLISSGSKKKEPRYACLSEANASRSHRMWTEVSSSVPHFLQMGSLHNPMMCKCLLKVLCPVSMPAWSITMPRNCILCQCIVCILRALLFLLQISPICSFMVLSPLHSLRNTSYRVPHSVIFCQLLLMFSSPYSFCSLFS